VLATDQITVSTDQDQLLVNVLIDPEHTGTVQFAVRATARDAANLPVVTQTNASIAVE